MSRYFAISTLTTTLQAKSGGTGSVTFTVTNNADEGIRTRARITALSGEESWFAIEGDKEREYREKTQQYTVNYTLPPTVPKGPVTFRLDVFAVENPDEVYSEGPVVQIEVAAPETPATNPKKFPWWIVAVVAAVILIAGLIVFWATRKTTEIVPVVTEKTEADAEQARLDLKFKVAKIYELTVDDDQVGRVISQDPEGDMEVYKKSHVMLTIGKEGAEVPPVIGGTIENALRKITAAGLVCRIATTRAVKKKIDEQPASPPAAAPASPQGLRMMTAVPMIFFTQPRVTNCDPEPGTLVEKNTSVTIYTGNSSRRDSIELKKTDLMKMGIRADSLGAYGQ